MKFIHPKNIGLMSVAVLSLATSFSSIAEQDLTPQALFASVKLANPELDAIIKTYQSQIVMAETQGRLKDPKLFVGLAPNTIGSDLGTRGNFKLSQALPWPGKLSLEREVAMTAAQSSEFDIALELRDLRYASSAFWAEWWYVHQALESNSKISEVYRQLVNAAKTRYENGVGLQQDYIYAQTQLLHIQHHSLELTEQMQRIRISINTLQHRESVAIVAQPADMPVGELLSYPGALWLSIEQHPKLKKLTAQESTTASKAALASLNRFPDFVAEAAYIGGLDPYPKRFQLGISISIPFDQATRRSAVTAAELERDAVRQLKAHAQRQLEGEVASTRSRIMQQRHIVNLYSETLESLAVQNQTTALNDYASGKSSFLSVATATRHAFDVSLTLARARADLFIAHAELEKLVGEDPTVAEDSL